MSLLRRAWPFVATAILAASLVCDPATAQSRGGGAGGRAGSTGVSRSATPSSGSSSLIPSAPAAQSLPTPSTSTPGALATPAPQVPGIAPLSPQLSTQFSSGGVPPAAQSGGGSGLALSPGSPSQTAPSAPGGGGKSLADCMGFWDRETHMTKAEWRVACQRTLQEYPTVR